MDGRSKHLYAYIDIHTSIADAAISLFTSKRFQPALRRKDRRISRVYKMRRRDRYWSRLQVTCPLRDDAEFKLVGEFPPASWRVVHYAKALVRAHQPSGAIETLGGKSRELVASMHVYIPGE
jgi:hypothetical protein